MERVTEQTLNCMNKKIALSKAERLNSSFRIEINPQYVRSKIKRNMQILDSLYLLAKRRNEFLEETDQRYDSLSVRYGSKRTSRL